MMTEFSTKSQNVSPIDCAKRSVSRLAPLLLPCLRAERRTLFEDVRRKSTQLDPECLRPTSTPTAAAQVQREEQDASRQRAKEGEEIGGYLAAELEQTTCPICYELMKAPKNTPTLLFPCGHTFCIECLTVPPSPDSSGSVWTTLAAMDQVPPALRSAQILSQAHQKANRNTCPYCRVKIASQVQL
jgi:hypothetical protein